MNKTKNSFILWIILLFFSLPIHALLEQNFKKLNMQNGLAGNSVYSIFKDQDGFIWFGTGDGLSRYDGKNIRSFINDEYNMTVEHMYDTSDGLLLFIASNYLHCFDRYRECFVKTADFGDKRYYNTKGLVLLNDSTYWSISKNKLHLLKRRLDKGVDNKNAVFSLVVLKEFILADEKEIINTLCESQDKNRLFLTTEKGKLLVFDLQTEKLESDVALFTNQSDSYLISSLVCDNDYLWMSTLGGGVLRYHLRSHSLDSFSRYSESKQLLSHDDVYALVPVGDKYIAATWNGYTVLSPDKKNGNVITEVNNLLTSFSYNLESRILSAYYDPQGLVYFGTHGGGVMVLDLREQFYERFCQNSTNEICDIVSDNKGNIWLATFCGEIMCSNSPFEPSEPLSFSSKNAPIVEGKAVLCAMKDEEGNLWFGNSDASITCYQSASGAFMDYHLPYEYRKNNNLKYSTYVWQLFIDSKHRFWVGTRNGLLLFDTKTKNFSQVLTEEGQSLEKHSIRAIVEGLNGELWLGTPDGLFKLVLNTDGKAKLIGNYEVEAGIAARYVRALLFSADGQLYIGYTDGLGVLEQNKDKIEQFYTTRDGMCSNFVTCITEDEKGHIWLGTNSGISRYNRHQSLFYNYYISGSNRSVFRAGNTLFFGNNYALTYFNPETVEKVPPIEKNVLLELEVNNKLVMTGEKVNGQVILQKGLPNTDKIVLAYANRNFSLSFSNLLYSEEYQKYYYRLLPYRDEWVACNGGGEKAAYTNLPAGNYVFEVKSIYPDGTDSSVNTLGIHILPHWSQTVWFRLCVLFIVVLIVGYAAHRIRRGQRRAKRELLLEHELHISNIEREKEKQIREERENFFTCVAHELRTPLTLVLAPLQELLYRKTNVDSDYNALSLMYENGNSLHRLVNDLLSVQKIEAGMMKLCLSEVNIVALLKETANAFRPMAASRKIDFVIDLPDESILLWADVEKVVSAVRNLLSNAFKYTHAGGNITLSIVENIIDEKDYCRIVVSDTGEGIPVELQHRVFDSFVTGGATPSFSTKVGIGLRIVKNTMDMHHGTIDLQSEPGKGSIFSLNFPKGKEHFSGNNCEETVYDFVDNETNMENETTGSEQANEEDASVTKYKTTLLVIEDNPDVRQYVVGLFKSKHNIYEAADGEEGVKQAMQYLPDLIISDIMMPVKDGFTCCKEIRGQVETAHIPILMLTAKAEDADIIKGAQLGVDDYMMKPFNPEILKAKVESLILRREHLKRIYTKSLMLKQTVQETENDDFMQKVINVIEANLANENFGVQMLADQLNMSQPTLYRKIKERSELSIIKVIRSVRMSKAASLIMERKYSIQEILEMVGFSDPNTFRKYFMEQFGVLPSKYGERDKE